MSTEQKPLNSGFGPKTTAEEVIVGMSLHGKLAVVTGGHSGIGLAITNALCKAGATVIVGARDMTKARANLAGIENVEIIPLDLSDPLSVDHFAEQFQKSGRAINILINNAGIAIIPFERDSRGFELQFSTNYLGHFQLTYRLWDALKSAGHARVVCLSSFGHIRGGADLEDPNFDKKPYDKYLAYGQSKSACSLFAVELDKRGKKYGVRAFAVHPGAILSGLVRSIPDDELEAGGVIRKNGELLAKKPGDWKSPQAGAATSIWCAISPQLNDCGGVYCEDCDISQVVAGDSKSTSWTAGGVRPWAIDPASANGLWELSQKLTQTNWQI